MIQLTLTTCLSIYETPTGRWFLTLISILLLIEMSSQQLNSGAGLKQNVPF